MHRGEAEEAPPENVQAKAGSTRCARVPQTGGILSAADNCSNILIPACSYV
ncbi:hypothetical protein PUN28_011225 [Cardiocondyla obscurior]|uniref:Uncharacterized protein n=1 Tax=Cardiocondyla obscurior TaxID=286306 RepID=A0AAW2FLF5_9HYME